MFMDSQVAMVLLILLFVFIFAVGLILLILNYRRAGNLGFWEQELLTHSQRYSKGEILEKLGRLGNIQTKDMLVDYLAAEIVSTTKTMVSKAIEKIKERLEAAQHESRK